MRRTPLILLSLALLAALGLPLVAAPAGTSSASGVGARLAGVEWAVATATSGTAPAVDQGAGPIESPIGSVVAVTTSVRAEGAASRATTTIAGAELAGGRISLARAELTLEAVANQYGAVAQVTAARVEGLVVDGQPIQPVAGQRIEMAGLGALVLIEQVPVDASSARAVAVRLEVTDPAAGLPLGGHVLGEVTASATAAPAAPPPEPASPPPAPPAPRADPSPDPAPPPAADDRPSRQPAARLPADPVPEVRRLPPPVAREEQPAPPLAPVGPSLSLPRRDAPVGLPLPAAGSDGYVFPVAGPNAGYIDDYGAPRAITGWHHGIDIFAPTGTPVRAVADGELSRVGVNTLGGNRVWLTDADGNEFYYAHLSAFAREAVNGARVRAGDVIGFVGNSGQAITTPPHLHFEVHPGGGDSVNPYPYLLAWERGTSVPLAFRAAAVARGQAPAAGALIVGVIEAIDRPVPSGDGIARPAS